MRLQGIGAVADGGTIVKNTSEVDGIKIENVEVNDGNTIVYYSIQSQKSEGEIHNLPSKNVKINNDNNVGADLSKYGLNPERILTDLKKTISQNLTEVGLTNLYRDYLGKDGIVTNYTKNIINVDSSDRKDYGSSVNLLKNQIDIEVNNAKDALKNSRVNEYLNRTLAELTNDKPKVGHLHPLTETINDMNKIFMSLGYSVMDGPEIETDEYNFVRTNLPPDHPARDLQDSIYIEEPNILLRTQTSSIEARILEKYKPPFKVVMPGRVYRNEKVNKSNHFTFHQYQLVCVQEKVSLADLFATIKYLFDNYLGDDLPIRFRNKYYPEVEPGVGPDRMCFVCRGVGKLKNGEQCGVCKGRGWREMGGAGIRHPKMLQMAGIDPTKWQGFAFGLGLDRWAMEKHNITDIRTLLGGNLAYKPNVD